MRFFIFAMVAKLLMGCAYKSPGAKIDNRTTINASLSSPSVLEPTLP